MGATDHTEKHGKKDLIYTQRIDINIISISLCPGAFVAKKVMSKML